MRILVTGGAGYIGSHTCLELLRSGHEVYIVDNLCNGNIEAIRRVISLSNVRIDYNICDVRDADALDKTFEDFKPEAVIHFAGLKSINESITDPDRYYNVNVGGMEVLLEVMERKNCNCIVFSSSATVYGVPQYLPCDEAHPLNPINPYGRTKLISENLLRRWSSAREERRAVALRYFNPVGADTSGAIGEDPNGTPNNLMPFIAQVAVGRRKCLYIFGDDYETIDGTGVRDYIHVIDLAHAHVSAVEQIKMLVPFEVFNIGTGIGISVMQMIKQFEKQTGKSLKFQMAPRRPGDTPEIRADVSKVEKKLRIRARKSVAEMCIDTWRWQRLNPNGYSVKQRSKH